MRLTTSCSAAGSGFAIEILMSCADVGFLIGPTSAARSCLNCCGLPHVRLRTMRPVGSMTNSDVGALPSAVIASLFMLSQSQGILPPMRFSASLMCSKRSWSVMGCT